MSEKLVSSNESEQQNKNPYEGMSRDALDAIANAKASLDPESATPGADLRTAVRESLEASGDERAFRRVYDMNNLELDEFVNGVSGELKHRRVDELKAIVEAYDNNETFGDRRTALREALEAAGDQRAFRRVYDMNNLELNAFVGDARRQLQEETSLSQEEALGEAYAEYEEREGTPYDVDKGRVKDIDAARDLAYVEEIDRLVRADPEAARAAGIMEKLRALKEEIEAALAARATTDEIGEPKDVDLGGDVDEIGEPKDINLGDDADEIGEPRDVDLGTGTDGTPEPAPADAGGTPEPAPADEGTAELPTVDDHEDEEETEERRGIRSIIRTAWARAGAAFATRMNRVGNYASTHKGETAAVVGAIALVGVVIAGRHFGWFDGGHGGGVNPTDVHPGANGGGAPGEFVTPVVPAGPEIPAVHAGQYPWDWMKAAMENGSIKVPSGMSAEDALHHFGQKAAEAGHKVEWFSVPGGEAIRVDGSDDTAKVAAVLSQFAK